jgi:penicillin-binding protein 1A
MAQRKLYRQVYQKNKDRTRLFSILKLFGFSFLFAIFAVSIVFIFYAKDLPRPEKFTEKQFVQSTKIYDRTGQVLLYEIYGEEKRTLVGLDQIPEHLKQAVIATEDANFYNHFGIDLQGILRSVLINLQLQEPVYGGSTIPQQLIRSTFFSTEKTIERKTREIVLALELDRRYSKDQILEWYLNQVPFGSNCYGVEAASQTFFDKPVSEISTAEAAILASLIKAPSYLSPYGSHKDELLVRKDYVLDKMTEAGFLTKEQTEEAKKEELEFTEKPIQIKAPYFTLWVKQQLIEKYGENGEEFLRKEGLRVYTSLDWELQEAAETAARQGIEWNKNYNAHNAGLVAISPKTGEVLALTVGNGDYYASPYPEGCTPGDDCMFDPKFNVVIGTESNPGRQPGSAFKPFVYATAFKQGYTSTTTVSDEKTNFGVWGENEEYLPQNYDQKFRGMVSLREGLAQSLNIPSIKTLFLAGTDSLVEKLTTNDFTGKEETFVKGLERSIKTAKDMGITTLNQPLSSYGPSIVLGGGEVKLLDITSAYGVFAAEGLRVSPVIILKIEDQQGNVIEENKKSAKRVLEKETARMINDILSDNEARTPMFGPRSNLYFQDFQVAAKTGTTQNYKDAWTVGYTPSISVGVWAGNNDNTPMAKKPAVVIAGSIFHNFMEKALLKYPKENFNPPSS